tara:strand:- start:1462 stop:1962 length:501 start_codon:yes stop_codon:yes gene_type:complete
VRLYSYIYLLIALQSCALTKNNDYILNYKELRVASDIDSLVARAVSFYPSIQEFSNSNACMKAYEELQKEGYLLLGYAIFQHKGKLSEGLAIQTGKDLGAHKILLSRELANSGSLDNVEPETGPGYNSGIKGSPIIEALLSSEEISKSNGKKFYLHNALFLVKTTP